MRENPPGPPHHHPRWDPNWKPPWERGRDKKEKFLLSRFIRFLFFMATTFTLIFLIAYALFSLVGFLIDPGGQARHPLIFLAACITPILFMVMVFFLAIAAYSRIGGPLIEMMEAVDRVAEGDFSVRVNTRVRGEIYRKLIPSFNRMVEELDKAEQQRNNLTNDVAHELRNPLHVIQGNLEGILDGVYQPTAEHLNATLDETRLLSRLVDDLQMLSLSEAGQLPLHRKQFLVKDLLSDVAASFEGTAKLRGVDLNIKLAESSEHLELNADSDRLDQVLSNLVGNALRFTPEGGQITLSAEAKDSGVRISVADTGSGIPSEDLPYVFERFWKGDRSRTHQDGGGSGLGLAISRQLVQAHGGQIHAESEPGKGTRFLIDLPNFSDHPLT